MKKKVIEFIPFIAMFFLSAVTLVIYLTVLGERSAVRILETCVAPLIPLVIPALNRIFKISVPYSFNVAVTAFSFVAINLASVLGFYEIIPYFDKVIHTAFGIVGAFGTAVFLMYGNGDKMKGWCFFTVILLCVLGLAALWEIYEYTASAIIGSDMQHWKPDLNAAGDMTVKEFFSDYNPLWDTIWDITVAAFGVFIFYGLVFIDKLCGYKVCKSVYYRIKFNGKEPSWEERGV